MSSNKSHFQFIPNFTYTNVDAKNIIMRTRIRSDILNRTAIFYDYYVKNSDRADLIAQNYYGDSTLDWLIYYANSIVDPYFGWILDTYDFEQFIIKKYGSIEIAQATLKQYEKIIQHKEVLFDDTVTEEKYLVVDYDNYIRTPIDDRRNISCFDFEERLNDSKRKIKLIDKNYLSQIMNEIKEIYKNGI